MRRGSIAINTSKGGLDRRNCPSCCLVIWKDWRSGFGRICQRTAIARQSHAYCRMRRRGSPRRLADTQRAGLEPGYCHFQKRLRDGFPSLHQIRPTQELGLLRRRDRRYGLPCCQTSVPNFVIIYIMRSTTKIASKYNKLDKIDFLTFLIIIALYVAYYLQIPAYSPQGRRRTRRLSGR